MSERDDVLARLLSGELSAEEEPARSMLERSRELRSELASLRAAIDRVDAAAREEHEILEEISDLAPTPEEDRVMERARATFVTPRTARPIGSISLLPIGMAAAVLLAIGLWLGGIESPAAPEAPERAPRVLGSTIVLLAPLGPVADYDEFRWEFTLRRGQAFEVTLWDDETGQEITTSPRVFEPRWSPPVVFELPQRLRWEVHVLDSWGNPVSSGVGEASRAR